MLAAQFPQWAHLPIEAVHSAGTDNALFRLGKDKVVRLPRILAATGQVEKEHMWLAPAPPPRDTGRVREGPQGAAELSPFPAASHPSPVGEGDPRREIRMGM